jgi:hypothetical protein
MQTAVGGSVRVGEPLSFGDLAGYQAKALERWFGYPFSYPVNLLYAVRFGVSPDRYDAFGPGAFLSDPRQPYGKIDVGAADQAMLDEGWYDAEHDGSVTFRWARSVATLLVPLHHGADLSVQLRVRPFSFLGASQQTLGVRINGVRHGPFPLQPDWQDVRFETPRREWHSGLNRIVLEFGRENVPAQVGAGADPRALAAAVNASSAALAPVINMKMLPFRFDGLFYPFRDRPVFESADIHLHFLDTLHSNGNRVYKIFFQYELHAFLIGMQQVATAQRLHAVNALTAVIRRFYR